MKIGEIALKTGFTIETIRFYEKAGLIGGVGRRNNNYRDYDYAQIDWLILIKQCRNIGLSLADIKTLIEHIDNPLEDCGEVNQIIENALTKVNEQLKMLHDTEKELVKLLVSCEHNGASKDCGIINGLTKHNNQN